MEIKLENVSFGYKGSKKEVHNGLSMTITDNRIYGLLGKNGVGKSTLLYLISGMLHSKSGQVTVDGMDAKEGNPDILREMFIVTEEFSLPPISLAEYVKINAPFYPNFSQQILEDCLSDFDMTTDINLKELSMGQKKKVFMAFALATNTKVLLMDEPTNGLDIPSKSQFRKAVSRTMTDDRIIIISTHQVHDIEQLLDHVIILSNDGVLMNESIEDISNEYVFEYRSPDNMADVIHAEPSLQGNAVMAPRGNRPETQINLELLFNAVTSGKLL